MKIPNNLKTLIKSLADNAANARELNRVILNMCEEAGIDTWSSDFVDAYSYIEGDCDTTQIFAYLESL